MKTPVSAGLPVFAILFAALLFIAGVPVLAQSQPKDGLVAFDQSSATITGDNTQALPGLMPPAGTVSYGDGRRGEDTHPILNLTPDKSDLVRLERDAASIIVGNPDHLGVLMDNRRLLILVPRAPGATYMTVLDARGEVIMQRHIIVASPKTNYIRIRRSCAGQGSDCEATSVYYCPGMCHQVGLVTSEGTGQVAPLEAPVPADETEEEDTEVVSDDVPAEEAAPAQEPVVETVEPVTPAQ